MTRGEESEEEDASLFLEVGALRLPLKPGTASGYIGVQRSTSKKQCSSSNVRLGVRILF